MNDMLKKKNKNILLIAENPYVLANINNIFYLASKDGDTNLKGI